MTLEGYKTYIAALGLVCLGIYQLTQGETESGIKTIAQGLGLLGLRSAISGVAGPTAPPLK
jgi:uncharacterized membrane protein YiaA